MRHIPNMKVDVIVLSSSGGSAAQRAPRQADACRLQASSLEVPYCDSVDTRALRTVSTMAVGLLEHIFTNTHLSAYNMVSRMAGSSTVLTWNQCKT